MELYHHSERVLPRSSLGAVLEARGLNLAMVKMDPHINVDPDNESVPAW